MPAIAYTKTATDDGAWDAGANEKNLSNDEADLRAAFAWADGVGDPTTKGDYRFIHHFVGTDGDPGAASTVACSSGIGVLNGGRGGTTIPDGDKDGVYAHLARHLEDSGATAPELKSARSRRAWDSTEIPPHPHDDMSHEHSHRAADGGMLTHTHDHHHDDGSVGHETECHEMNAEVVPGQIGVYSARRPMLTGRPSRAYGSSFERLERCIPGKVEVRAKRDGKPMVCGYAAVFNTPTTIDDGWGSYMEKCAAGCFTKTIADGADVRALFNHDPNFVLGRTKSGTLRLMEDDHGLFYEADPPETAWARDLMETMRRGDVDGSSFGFRVIRDNWTVIIDPTNPDPDDDGDIDAADCRSLLEVQLFDVSPVTFPAYPQTDSAVRTALVSAGFDLDALSRVIVRGHRGMSLASRDRETVRAAIDYLRRYLPSESQADRSAPVRTGHPPTPQPPPVTPTLSGHVDPVLLRRLDALAKIALP